MAQTWREARTPRTCLLFVRAVEERPAGASHGRPRPTTRGEGFEKRETKALIRENSSRWMRKTTRLTDCASGRVPRKLLWSRTMSCKPYFRERSSRQIVGLEGASDAADVTASLACEEHGTSMGHAWEEGVIAVAETASNLWYSGETPRGLVLV
jgi:hypothetical protein